MAGPSAQHPGRVEQDDEPVGAAGETDADRPADPHAERFAAIVRGLARQDPRFVRRVTAPPPTGLAVGDLMLVLGLVATLLLGALPLALGLHSGITALLVMGGLGCVVLPVGAPLAVRAVLRRARPLMP